MYSRDDAKVRATKLRTILKNLGHDINHAHALEVIAGQYNYKNWNTCAAALDKRADIFPVPRGWQVSGNSQLARYEIGIDKSLTHVGAHPAVIRYKASEPRDGSGFATFMQSFDPVGYRGKRVQFSATLMCEDCDGVVTIWLRADGKNRGSIAFDNLEDKGVGEENGPISDTTTWTQRTIVLDIPEETKSLSMGFYLRGQGAGYATGFMMNEVSQDMPLSVDSPSYTSQEPMNLQLRLTQ
ncbi:MAG: glyoxalase superfamily protein [Granulosicoccus sp.]